MSNGDYAFLKGLDEGEFRVWLAGRLDSGDGRINLIEDVQERHSVAIDRIHLKCKGHDWIAPTVKAMLGVAIAQLLAALGWALAKII